MVARSRWTRTVADQGGGGNPQEEENSERMFVRDISRLAVAIAAAAIFVAPLGAQQADTTGPIKFTGTVGLVNTAGNSNVTTVNVGDRIDYKAGGWGLTQLFSVVYGRNEGVTNTSIWGASLRGDRKVGEKLAVYLLTGWDRNTFAGVDRRWEEGAGLLAHLLAQPKNVLDGEVGISFIQQLSTLGTHDDFPSARIASTYKHLFTQSAYFLQSVELLPDLQTSDNLRFNTETGLVAPISSHIGLKISYVIKYDNLPEPGFEKTDRLLTSGVQITY
jgi:putative salt-induced outer membrane protein YdiY